jgi:hypothetical protein
MDTAKTFCVDTVNTICGWELNNPDPQLFDSRVLEVSSSCKDCKKVANCPVASEAIRCLVPKRGELVELDRGRTEDGKRFTYFALVHDEDMKFIEVLEPEHYWAKAACVDSKDLPQEAMTLLRQKLGRVPGISPAEG